MKIRTARAADAPRIAEIYRPYVEKTAISFEYEAPDADEMARRMAAVLKKYPYLVAEKDGKIIGYAYAGPFVGREAYDWSAEMSIYIDWNARHGGIGKALYNEMESLLKKMGVININACIGYVEEEDEYLNHNSVDFHAHLGYQWVGLFHKCGYKFGRWYDMVWMEKMLGPHPDVPQKLIPYPDLEKD